MNRTLKAILLSAGLCSLPSLCFSAVVYDNSSNNLNQQYSPPTPTLEFGDEITLDPLTGGMRTLSLFEFSVFLNAPSLSGQSVMLQLYANPGVNNPPSTTPFYTSELIPLQKTGGDSYRLIPPSGSIFTLPETFTWTVIFSNLGAGETGGLLVYGPPTIGTSPGDGIGSYFWQKDGAGAWGQNFIGGGALSDFAARVTAVPEPGVLALGGLGALLLIGLKRFRKGPR